MSKLTFIDLANRTRNIEIERVLDYGRGLK